MQFVHIIESYQASILEGYTFYPTVHALGRLSQRWFWFGAFVPKFVKQGVSDFHG